MVKSMVDKAITKPSLVKENDECWPPTMANSQVGEMTWLDDGWLTVKPWLMMPEVGVDNYRGEMAWFNDGLMGMVKIEGSWWLQPWRKG